MTNVGEPGRPGLQPGGRAGLMIDLATTIRGTQRYPLSGDPASFASSRTKVRRCPAVTVMTPTSGEHRSTNAYGTSSGPTSDDAMNG